MDNNQTTVPGVENKIPLVEEKQQESSQEQGSNQNPVKVEKPVRESGFNRLIKSMDENLGLQKKPDDKPSVETTEKTEPPKSSDQPEKPKDDAQDVKPDTAEKPTDFKYKPFEEMEKDEVVKVAKTFQSRYDKLDAEHKKVVGVATDVTNKLQYILQNPVEFIKQIAPELADSIGYTEESADALVRNWQRTDLLEALKKKYTDPSWGIDSEWYPIAEHMATPGTPSFDYMEATRSKRSEIMGRANMAKQNTQRNQEFEQHMLRVTQERNDSDIQWLKQTYPYITDELLQKFGGIFNAGLEKMKQGDALPDEHPQRIKNMVRGIFFDELVKAAVEKVKNETADAIHAEYKKKGISLDKTNSMPVDITKPSSSDSQPVDKNNSAVVGKSSFTTPMRRQYGQYTK
jgi:hypothetical protein